MTSIVQHWCWISTLRRRAASIALALAVIGLPAVMATPSQAQTFTLLRVFTGAPDGAYPVAGFVQDTAGYLYGITQQGGITTGVCTGASWNGCGTVFQIDPFGNKSVVYRFTGGTDGRSPSSGLAIDASGNLYGTTAAAVFKLDTAGKTLTPLHSPGAYAGLAIDSAGILYRSSADGIFSLDPSSGKYTVLATGVGSSALLALDSAGNLYGTTGFNCKNPCGTVFELDTHGTYTTRHTFPQGA
jgi:uncharacterized repeat protein (TIGR03803 family)